MINWKNSTENLIITLIAVVFGAMLGSYITFKVTDVVIKSNEKMIIEAINKSTTEIKNETNIKKIKKSDSKLDNTIELDSFPMAKKRFKLFNRD